MRDVMNSDGRKFDCDTREYKAAADTQRPTLARQPGEEHALPRVRTAAVGHPARMCCGEWNCYFSVLQIALKISIHR